MEKNAFKGSQIHISDMLSYIYINLNTAIGFRLGLWIVSSQKSINLKCGLVICFADNDDY